jgi:hypothetical protein
MLIPPYGWFSLDSQAPPKRTTSWMQYFIHIVIYVTMTYILSPSSIFNYRILTPNSSHILSPFSGAKVENSHIWSRLVVVICLVHTSIHRSKVSRLSATLRIEPWCGVSNDIPITLPFPLNIQFLGLQRPQTSPLAPIKCQVCEATKRIDSFPLFLARKSQIILCIIVNICNHNVYLRRG